MPFVLPGEMSQTMTNLGSLNSKYGNFSGLDEHLPNSWHVGSSHQPRHGEVQAETKLPFGAKTSWCD